MLNAWRGASGPYRFMRREYFIVSYETDPDAIRAALPEPLEPVGNTVLYEWIAMPDSSGFGEYVRALSRLRRERYSHSRVAATKRAAP